MLKLVVTYSKKKMYENFIYIKYFHKFNLELLTLFLNLNGHDLFILDALDFDLILISMF